MCCVVVTLGGICKHGSRTQYIEWRAVPCCQCMPESNWTIRLGGRTVDRWADRWQTDYIDAPPDGEANAAVLHV